MPSPSIDSSDLRSLMVRSATSEQVTLPTHVYARLAWSQSNHQKANQEQRQKEEHRRILNERMRLLTERVQANRIARKGLDRAAVEHSRQEKWCQAEEERRIRVEDDSLRAAMQRALVEKVRVRREMAVGRVAASRNALLEQNRRHRREESRMQQFALDEKARRLATLREEHKRKLAERYVAVDTALLRNNDSLRLLATSGSSSPGRLPRPSSAGEFRTPTHYGRWSPFGGQSQERFVTERPTLA